MRAARLQDLLERLTAAIRDVESELASMKAEHDPLASHIFVSGRSYRNVKLKDGDTIQFGSVIAVFAGAYRRPCSSHGIRKFWMSISGKGEQPIAFAMASASLNLA